jgi:Ca2+-binding RTX toxin-like protein
VLDNCGVCDADPTNDCTQDCNGSWGGSATVDRCGTCDDNAANDCTEDCNGVLGGPARADACGTCDTDTTNDCDPSPALWTPRPVVDELETAGITCDPSDWTQKYMRYRRRLRGDGTAAYPGFVSIGSAPGQSLPAGSRMLTANCVTDWQVDACDYEEELDLHGMYKWGDGTIWLGEYLEVLASEWAVFTDMGLDTTETEADLLSALRAFDRLDDGAETSLGYTAERNGFYLRDDVPASFAFLRGGQPRFPRSDTDPEGNQLIGYECIGSDVACDPPRLEDGNFTSQDQTVALVHGMAMVHALIPDSLIVDEVPIRHTAREMVDRMVWHLGQDNWKALDPAGNVPPPAWGGDLVGFSYTLAEAAKRICGDDFRDFGSFEGYQTLRSQTIGQAAWEGLPAIWEATFHFNRNMGMRAAAYTGDWEPEEAAQRAVHGNQDYFALTYAIINDVPLPEPFSPWRLEALLDSAPCSGPCSGYDHCEDAPGWRGDSVNTSPDNRAGNHHHPKAEFNGLDYMALHNLYYLYRKGDFGRRIESEEPEHCAHFRSIEQLRNDSPEGHVYDTTDLCVAMDAEERFCGRSFADWLTAAERGEAAIVTGGKRWDCASDGKCTITNLLGGVTTRDPEDELFLGSDGDDVLSGGSGNDCLYGFDGKDTLSGGPGLDTIHGGPGDDTIHGEAEALLQSGEADTLWGEEGNDFIAGGPGKDSVYGGPGDDQLTGGNGDDVMEGGPGNDYLSASLGDDYLSGGPGNDHMLGGAGDDALMGDDGNDRMNGQGGNDAMHGMLGRDFLLGGDGDDIMISGDGDGAADRSCGGDGKDTIWGGWQGDECRGHDKDANSTSDGDQVHCSNPNISREQCSQSAFDAWNP